jgi:hypothetical protein
VSGIVLLSNLRVAKAGTSVVVVSVEVGIDCWWSWCGASKRLPATG